jgi:acyl-CoA thioesterase
VVNLAGDSGELRFELETAVERAGEGWACDLQQRWHTGEGLNGGYLLAVMVRAMLGEAERPDPVTVTAHFLARPNPGPAKVHTEIIKAGRTFATVTGLLVQDGRELIRTIGAFGDLAAQAGPSRVSTQLPDVPQPDDCVTFAELLQRGGRRLPEFQKQFDLRLPPDSPWFGPKEGNPYEITGWTRFHDGTPPSTTSAIAFIDAFPPALLGSVRAGGAPTVELTAHVRARPAPGWLLGRYRTRVLLDGLMEEDGEIWDSEGRPVALSRQLALVLPVIRA